MELYRIWYKTNNGCLPTYINNITPRLAQLEFYKNNPEKEIIECEHIGKRVNTKCKIIHIEEMQQYEMD